MPSSSTFFFFFNDTATTEIYTLSLHDALPISPGPARGHGEPHRGRAPGLQRRGEPLQRVHSALPAGADGEGDREGSPRSEEHTSELQSLAYLVCRLLLEKKKKKTNEDAQYTAY